MNEQSLKQKTIKGVAWSGIDNVTQFAMSFVVSIVLARLLSPDDYGLIGIIAIFTAISNALINAGFSYALIRKNNATEDDYNTVFVVNLGLSVVLYVIIYFCSPLIANFFNRCELILLTRVSTVTIIIGALAIVQQTRLTKKIDFKTQTKITLISSIVSGIIGISMALLGFGVWSLVAQQISTSLLKTILLWLFNHWIPSFKFSLLSFNELFGFGWKLMVGVLLDSIWKQLYQLVVGKFYSPATLGQYTRGKNFSELLSVNLTTVIQRVTYPVMSSIQEDKSRLTAAYRRIIKVTMYITFVAVFALAAVSEPMIICLIGKKWLEAAHYLPLICLSTCLYPLHAINLNMLQVQGRSDLFLGLEIVKKIILLAPLFIGAFVGIYEMLYTNIFVSIISFFLNSHYSGRYLHYSSWMQLKDITPSFFIALSVSLPVYFLKFLPISHWIILPVQIVVLFIGVLAVSQVVKTPEYLEVRELVISGIKK